MAIVQSQVPFHWAFFLALEDDLLRLSRYVEIAEDNMSTYSIEICRLLMSACAESDSVLRQIAWRQGGYDLDDEGKAPTGAPNKLAGYNPLVTQFAPGLKDMRVDIPRFGLHLHPWESWTQAEAPKWWSAHNQIKHGRHVEFQAGSLRHCLNALAGLLVAVVHLHHDLAVSGLPGMPQLFVIPKEFGGSQSWDEKGFSQIFYLDPSENPANQRYSGPPDQS
ncbi:MULTISPECIES: hypothetical protein [Xanthomonas]|uniref:hypothetical protein n=1 Tax=Xanthomonas TaxID=338 RepID=UPI001F43C7FB|nr:MULTISPECIES: hypothetical protein [Xanthomonas]MCE4302066.1 hypothetical protein [Xanthomonas hortorum pv. vitians]MCE4551057.1 hypothetical protein [Xanthomonas hortorum pv. vitians]MEA9657620.1 hypothetical protein [Xanthomonas campestris pv. raphani]MEB2181731.1 hypothetical protein [Xanthomonas campestris pv. campestris]